ncbi:hypothetical protein LBMAG53_17470 [Planctomycetota bacterium]|nr:hypothetical protein LBMAG53_17470 [Planctomycetota bacterium]
MPPDAVLLGRYAESRDAEAFADLVVRHAGLVYGTCQRVLRDTHAAEDAAQDCFLALARHARQVRGNLAGWLHTTALRAALRRRADVRVTLEQATDVPAAETDREQRELLDRLDQALAELPDDHREVVVLRFLEGQTQEQIALRLGCSQPTIHRRIDRGLTELRRRLNVDEPRSAVLGAALGAALVVPPPGLLAQLGKVALVAAPASHSAAATGLAWFGLTTAPASILAAGLALGAAMFVLAAWTAVPPAPIQTSSEAVPRPQVLPADPPAPEPVPVPSVLDQPVAISVIRWPVGAIVALLAEQFRPLANQRFAVAVDGDAFAADLMVGRAPLRVALDQLATQTGLRWRERSGLVLVDRAATGDERAAALAAIERGDPIARSAFDDVDLRRDLLIAAAAKDLPRSWWSAFLAGLCRDATFEDWLPEARPLDWLADDPAVDAAIARLWDQAKPTLGYVHRSLLGAVGVDLVSIRAEPDNTSRLIASVPLAQLAVAGGNDPSWLAVGLADDRPTRLVATPTLALLAGACRSRSSLPWLRLAATAPTACRPALDPAHPWSGFVHERLAGAALWAISRIDPASIAGELRTVMTPESRHARLTAQALTLARVATDADRKLIAELKPTGEWIVACRHYLACALAGGDALDRLVKVPVVNGWQDAAISAPHPILTEHLLNGDVRPDRWWINEAITGGIGRGDPEATLVQLRSVAADLAQKIKSEVDPVANARRAAVVDAMLAVQGDAPARDRIFADPAALSEVLARWLGARLGPDSGLRSRIFAKDAGFWLTYAQRGDAPIAPTSPVLRAQGLARDRRPESRSAAVALAANLRFADLGDPDLRRLLASGLDDLAKTEIAARLSLVWYPDTAPAMIGWLAKQPLGKIDPMWLRAGLRHPTFGGGLRFFASVPPGLVSLVTGWAGAESAALRNAAWGWLAEHAQLGPGDERLAAVKTAIRATGACVVIGNAPALAQRITFDIQDMPFQDAAAQIGKICGMPVSIEPQVNPPVVPITLKVVTMRLGPALEYLVRLGQQTCLVDERGLHFAAAVSDPAAAPAAQRALAVWRRLGPAMSSMDLTFEQTLFAGCWDDDAVINQASSILAVSNEKPSTPKAVPTPDKPAPPSLPTGGANDF